MGGLPLTIRIERGLSEWLSSEWFTEPPDLPTASVLAQRFPHVDVTYRSRGDARFGESGQEALRRAGDTALNLAAEFEESLAMVGHGASVLGVRWLRSSKSLRSISRTWSTASWSSS